MGAHNERWKMAMGRGMDDLRTGLAGDVSVRDCR